MQELRLEPEQPQQGSGLSSAKPNNTGDDSEAVPEMDLWAGELGGGDEYSLGSAPKPTFVNKEEEAAKKKRLLIYGVLGAIVLVVGFFVFASDSEMLDSFMGDDAAEIALEPPIETDSNELRSKDETVVEATLNDPVVPDDQVDRGANGEPLNPYWNLPNEILKEEIVFNGVWTAEEEDAWRQGLTHKFLYQRYKTVMEVKKSLLSGSEVILWEAVNEPKLWVRMRAVMGLADFGIPVSFEVTEQSLGTAKPYLVNKFLKRFRTKSTYGERFMIRQYIRLLNEEGRVIALQALKREQNELRDLYMIAATYDPSTKVQRWLRKNMPKIPADKVEYYRSVVLGQQDYVYKYLSGSDEVDENLQENLEVEDVVIFDLSEDQQS